MTWCIKRMVEMGIDVNMKWSLTLASMEGVILLSGDPFTLRIILLIQNHDIVRCIQSKYLHIAWFQRLEMM